MVAGPGPGASTATPKRHEMLQMRVGGASHDSWHHPCSGVMFVGSGLPTLRQEEDGIRSTWPSDRPFVPLR